MARSTNNSAFQVTKTGILLRVRLTPKASRDRITTVGDTSAGSALRAYVRAPPADSAANRALIALVSEWLRVPKSTVTLTAGSRSRIKTLHVAGDGNILHTAITAKLAR